MERNTAQKKIILSYLKKVKNHPTAEEIYSKVKKELPQISLATVYRNLNKLKQKGQIKEINSSLSHFDGDTSPHAHFICQECQKIYDVFYNHFPLNKPKIKVGKINQYQIYFYGICKKCEK